MKNFYFDRRAALKKKWESDATLSDPPSTVTRILECISEV
jgi:hypothetical protein